MSSSPTARTSTTGSSTSSPSPAEPTTSGTGTGTGSNASAAGGQTGPRRVAVIACGAIAQPCGEVVARRGWPVDVFPLPPLLHNQPDRIAGQVDRLAEDLQGRYDAVVIGYADCGTYGALDAVCEARGVSRLPGLHCYDVYGGADRVREMFESQPGTYVLTDFLVRSFHRSVVVELGLDRYPELRDDYFAHYTRMVWLAQQPDDELTALAEAAAALIGLPLTVVPTGHTGLERALEDLVGAVIPVAGRPVAAQPA